MASVTTKVRCRECERVFDLLNEDDANEWYYGHDCEDPALDHLEVMPAWALRRGDG